MSKKRKFTYHKPNWKSGGTLFKILMAQKNLCCYCEKPMTNAAKPGDKSNPRMRTREHLTRRRDGGSNFLSNMAISCLECNSTRGDTPWMIWKSIKLGETDDLQLYKYFDSKFILSI